MTVKDLFEGALIEVRKEGAPDFHLREFNYYANESASEVIDDLYIAFETGQKVLDYLKGIKKTQRYDATNIAEVTPGEYPSSLRFALPSDYRHLTNLVVTYKTDAKIYDDCYEIGDLITYGSKRLDSDTYAAIISNPYTRPRYFQPYHMIMSDQCFLLTGDHSNLSIVGISMDYLKVPKRIVITYQQAYQDTVDNSDELEFDDITSRKILDRLILKIMERYGNPRTRTHLEIQQIQPMADVLQQNRVQG
jgi:hypothetical protein